MASLSCTLILACHLLEYLRDQVFQEVLLTTTLEEGAIFAAVSGRFEVLFWSLG